jgi:hypothetical protein
MTESVVFILAPRPDPDTGAIVNTPIGTGFLVRDPSQSKNPSDPYSRYLITAAHVVRQCQDETLVRLKLPEDEETARFYAGPPEEVLKRTGPRITIAERAVRKWHLHPEYDVAIALMPEDKRFRSLGFQVEHETMPQLGDRVYFVGLLADVPDMVARNIPIVRSGTLGAIYQEHVPVDVGGNTRLWLKAHLIDCHSYRGFSGSPCFLQQDVPKWVGAGANRSIGQAKQTVLLGLISGHFHTSVQASGNTNEDVNWTVPVNSGVGIVTPVEAIRATLALEEVARERNREAAARE